MNFTTTELAMLKGVSDRTFRRYVAKLKDQGLFQKRSMGRFYSWNEARHLSALLGFELPESPPTMPVNAGIGGPV